MGPVDEVQHEAGHAEAELEWPVLERVQNYAERVRAQEALEVEQRDLRQRLHAHGVHRIVRVLCCADDCAHEARPEGDLVVQSRAGIVQLVDRKADHGADQPQRLFPLAHRLRVSRESSGRQLQPSIARAYRMTTNSMPALSIRPQFRRDSV